MTKAGLIKQLLIAEQRGLIARVLPRTASGGSLAIHAVEIRFLPDTDKYKIEQLRVHIEQHYKFSTQRWAGLYPNLMSIECLLVRFGKTE